MTKLDAIQLEGTIAQALPRGSFLVEREDGSIVNAHKFQVELDKGDFVLAYLPVSRHHIKILPGDRVRVKLDSNDLRKGRITYRLQKK